MRLLLSVVFLGITTFAGRAGAAEPFVYTVLGYPKTGASCLEAAIRVGELLRQAAGVPIQRASCDRENEDGFDLRVVYLADVKIPLVSTEEMTDYAGTYPSRAACEADLPAQKALFEEHTRLKPFLAYCYHDESGLAKSIGARIDAVGTPAEWPQVFQDYVYSPPRSPAQVKSDILAAMKSRGLFPNVVSLAPSRETSGWYRVVLKFYGAQQVTWHLKRDQFYYVSPAECEAQLAGIRSVLAAQGLVPASAFCAWDGMLLRASVNFLSLAGTPWYRTDVASDKFRSVDACVADRARIVEYFKTVLKQPVFGGVCALDREFVLSPLQKSYRLELLSPCESFESPECEGPLPLRH